MIDITTSIIPIDGEYPNIKRWAGSIAIKGGEDDSILYWCIESQSPKHIVETQICALESMRDAIEKLKFSYKRLNSDIYENNKRL